MIVDTDILIWYLRGHEGARSFVEGARPFSLSAVTYMELVSGMRNKGELLTLRRTLKAWGARVLPLTEPISHRAMVYVEEHFLSHSLRLADALIAATAVEHGLPVATANTRHYRVIRELAIAAFHP
ncbi:MAG: PIN domain-containing protein [Deferrisomatales bacterium]